MKWYCKVRQPSEQKNAMNSSGPFHRFYQQKQWEKSHAGESRLESTAAQRTGSQEGSLRRLDQRFEFHRRLRHEADDLFYQAAQKESLPLGPSASSVTSSPTRIAWLQQNFHQLPKAVSLRTRFSDAGMQVKLHQWTVEDVAPLECDLILFECFDRFEQEMIAFLAKIRLFSQAPLIVLTDNYALDWSICALRSGADAIFTVNMPDEVIFARSNALLRRWLPS